MEEIWKDVVGYEGYYKVSNIGNVISLERKCEHATVGEYILKSKVMSQELTKDGYVRVSLSKKGRIKTQIHRVVAEAFIPNPENKPEVNHINGAKNDNRVENLEWCTRSENVRHAFKTGLTLYHKGENSHRSKITEEQAREIKYGHKGVLQKDIAEMYGLSRAAVCLIRKGWNWKHI